MRIEIKPATMRMLQYLDSGYPWDRGVRNGKQRAGRLHTLRFLAERRLIAKAGSYYIVTDRGRMLLEIFG